MSAALKLANPRRIKAAHRRRWKCSTGSRVYANDNPYRYTDPDGQCPKDQESCPPPPKPQPKTPPKPKTLQTITVTAHAIPVGPEAPSIPEIGPFVVQGIAKLGEFARFAGPGVGFLGGILVPGNLAPSDCGDGRCGMMSELGEKAPTDAPSGTLPLDKAKGKFGLSKDDVHKIKDNATGGMGGGRTWVGVDPNGEVGTSENGKWVPQGTVDELKH